jgi:hypothetical protein
LERLPFLLRQNGDGGYAAELCKEESGPKSGERWKSSARPASFPQYSTGGVAATFAGKAGRMIQRLQQGPEIRASWQESGPKEEEEKQEKISARKWSFQDNIR